MCDARRPLARKRDLCGRSYGHRGTSTRNADSVSYPISSRVSPCSSASGTPYSTTTSPSRSTVDGSGWRPTMPSRRIAVTVTSPLIEIQIGEGLADAVGARRQHDGVQFFAQRVRLVDAVAHRRAERCAAASRSECCGCRRPSSRRATPAHRAAAAHARRASGSPRAFPERLRSRPPAAALELRVVLRAHEHRQIGPQLAHRFQDAAATTSGSANVSTSTLQCSSPTASRISGLRAVAEDDRIARLPRRLHATRIHVERDVLEALLLQHAREVLPDAAEAADDHVIAAAQCRMRPRARARSRSGAGVAASEQHIGDAAVVADQQRARSPC